jgi:CheY-like chemotaxis protein
MKEVLRILVVDDDPGIGQMLAKALARFRLVDATTSAEEALEKSEAKGYDAALVDLVMPGRDGADLSETLRRRFPGLPIGLLTGYMHSPLIPAVEKSGMAVSRSRC